MSHSVGYLKKQKSVKDTLHQHVSTKLALSFLSTEKHGSKNCSSHHQSAGFKAKEGLPPLPRGSKTPVQPQGTSLLC